MTIVARELVRDAQNRPPLPAPCRVNERSGGGVRRRGRGGVEGYAAAGQWAKGRVPVRYGVARPASAAAMTSASRTEPPGWTIALMPASSNSCGAAGDGEKGRRAPPPAR